MSARLTVAPVEGGHRLELHDGDEVMAVSPPHPDRVEVLARTRTLRIRVRLGDATASSSRTDGGWRGHVVLDGKRVLTTTSELPDAPRARAAANALLRALGR